MINKINLNAPSVKNVENLANKINQNTCICSNKAVNAFFIARIDEDINKQFCKAQKNITLNYCFNNQ